MNRARCMMSLLVLGVLTSVAVTSAQTTRRVITGSVSGSDLAIEGALTVTRGATLRWSVQAFDVVGLRELRPSPRAELRAITSFARDRASATLTLDEDGRGLLEIPVPDDAPGSFHVVLELTTRARIVRRFELDVAVSEARTLTVEAFPRTIFPGSSVHVVGRVAASLTDEAAPGETVALEVRDTAGPVRSAVQVRTDANGVFTHRFEIPRDVRLGMLSIGARTVTRERPIRADAGVSVVARTAPPLLVAVRPASVVVESDARVGVDVVVRRPDGRPLPRATVTFTDGRDVHREQRATTDARGRASLVFVAPRIHERHTDVPIGVRVERAGVGTADASALVRVAHAAFAGALSVEGGRLVPDLEGRVYVRAVRIDGRPAPEGTPVRLVGPRLPPGLEGRTDSAGVAVFDVRLGARAEDGEDACGGDAATSITATIGEGARPGTVSRCAAVDADGVVRVRASQPRVLAGRPVRVMIARAARVAGAPIVIELLAESGAVVATRTVPGDASEAELGVPADVRGTVIVRARVLFGAERTLLRGASTAVRVGAEEPLAVTSRLDAETMQATATLEGPAADSATAIAIAMPIDEARARFGSYDVGRRIAIARPAPSLAVQRAPSLLEALLADVVPSDVAAPAALVAGVVTALPSPPEGTGSVLRDPYRARARFVEGRLALVFRAVEVAVDASVPARIDDVAFVRNGRYAFNASILDVASGLGTLGTEGATGLSGEPLTVAQLASLDPAFTYDNVARRITRKRLFMLLLELRAFVRSNNLDLAWARPGEPRQWLEQLLESSGTYASIEPRHLVDGWGRPFQLVPTSRPLEGRVVPVPGFALVSGGPDGRVGNGDDIVDPAARVLPSGGVYAQAVGEDALVARLSGVELGRMTVQQGVETFAVDAPYVPEVDAAIAPPDVYGATYLPDVIEPEPDALALRRITGTVPSALVRLGGGAARRAEVQLDAEPRTWGVLTFVTSRAGSRDVSLATARTGSAILVGGAMPERLHVGEPLTTDVLLTNVTDTDLDLRIGVTAEGVTARAASSTRVPAGQTTSVQIELGASAPGTGRVTLRLTADGREVGRVDARLAVDRGEHPERRRVTALVGARPIDVTLRAPAGAHDVSARLVLVSPRALSDLPDIAETRRISPALVAWSRVMAGEPVDPALRAGLLRNLGVASVPLYERAAAVLALASLDDDDARVARQSLEGTLAAGQPGTPAAFVALASAGVPDDAAEAQDATTRFLASALVPLRRTLRDAPDDTLALARAAAALLVASPEDAHGLAMLARIEPRVVALGNGALVESPGDADRLDVVSATFALAIASHQVGKLEQRDRLLRGAMSEIATLGRAGGEPALWYFAVGAYGLLPSATPRATVRIGGETRDVSLADGRVVLPIALEAGEDVRIRVSTPDGESAIAEIEGAYVVPFVAEEGPLHVTIRGDVGRVGRLAAIELGVHANEAVARPVVEISLPPGVVADDALLGTIRRTERVVAAEARRPGFVRITLDALASGAELRIPLPLEHRARGRSTGLAISAYPASSPYRRTIVAPQTIDVPGEAE